MTRRSGEIVEPRGFAVAGEWPDCEVDGPRHVWVALEISRRLRAAAVGRSLRDVARAAGLSVSTVHRVLAGRTWCDVITVCRLEDAVDAELWPSRDDQREG